MTVAILDVDGTLIDTNYHQPDIVIAALEKAGGGDALLVGDSTWDCEAASRAGIRTVAVLTGGFSEQELRDAGAVEVFTSIEELRRSLADLPSGDTRLFAPRRGGNHGAMSILDKITGRAKKAAGDIVDDPSLRREGRNEERKGEAKDEMARAEEHAERKAEEVADLERRT